MWVSKLTLIEEPGLFPLKPLSNDCQFGIWSIFVHRIGTEWAFVTIFTQLVYLADVRAWVH